MESAGCKPAGLYCPILTRLSPFIRLEGTVRRNSSQRAVAWSALWVLFAGRLVFAAILLPPWQNPDEPAHFAVTRTLAQRPDLDLVDRKDVGVQSEILGSMAEHHWWHAYSELPPDPLPRTFVDTPGDHLGDESYTWSL